MAHTISARKRVRQNQAHNARNRWRKRRIHNAVKSFEEVALRHGDYAKAEAAFKEASSVLDRVAGKGTIHRNKAARKKSRMAKKLAALKAGA